MSRELNPDLFPELQREARSSVSMPDPRLEPHGATSGMREQDWRLLLGQFDLLKRKFKEYESRLETTNTRLSDFINSTKAKYDRLAGMTQRLEEMAKASIQDLSMKQSQLISKVNERKLSDTKVQELVDRHNQLVQNFEQRLNQMSKVIAEQELQLMASRAEIKEAQREFVRLKRL
jgi:hypothetical protein